MLILPISICLINLILILLNYKKSIWFNIFIMLAIPLGNLFPNFNTINFLRIGSFSVYEINIIILFIYIFIKGKIKLDNILIAPIFLIFIYILNIIINISNYGLNCVFADSKDYILSLVIIFIAIQINDDNSLNKLIDTSIKASFCSSIIIFIGYIVTTRTIIPVNIRYGFSIQTLYIFSIPYIIYVLLMNIKRSFWLILNVILQLYLVILAQNRTNLILILSILLFSFLYYGFIYKGISNDKKVVLRIFCILLILILGIFIIYIFLNKSVKHGYLGRINEMIFNGFKTDSTEVRNINIEYYINEIKHNIWGYGLGKYMPAISIYTNKFEELTLYNYGFDNIILTMSYKVGILAMVLYNSIYIYLFIKLYKNRKKSIENILYLISLLGIYIASGFMTQQLLRNISIYIFFIMFMIFSYKKIQK